MLTMTLEQLRQQHKVALQELIDHAGSQVHLAKMLQLEMEVVKSWVRRGRISKNGAIKVTKHETLKEKFTLQQLRPEL